MLPTNEEISHAKWLEARGILGTKKIKKLAKRFRKVLKYENEKIEELTCRASLAYHGLLGSVGSMILRDVDLSPISAEHMASLVSSVTSQLHIENVSGCDLVSLFTSLKCEVLVIIRQSLGKEETRALVEALESVVEGVELETRWTLDMMNSLAAYSGQGMCGELAFWRDDLVASYSIEEVRTWARRRNWKVALHDEDGLVELFRK